MQNPLSSLTDDVAAVQRALSQVEGPVLLVGHSWGGTVITQAGQTDQVLGLVYVAAFAPGPGQSTNDLQSDFPTPGYAGLLKPDAAGFLWFPQDALPTWFAQDLPPADARTLAAVQNPIRAAAFDERVTVAAWQSRPSWYLLTEQDHMITPDLQRAMAKRIKAHVVSVPSSHVPFLTHPVETAALILDAAMRFGGPR